MKKNSSNLREAAKNTFYSGKLPKNHFVWGAAGPSGRAPHSSYCAVTTDIH